ncbi:MAG TPA: NAD(P)/FAD-dependent oxidoreductase [Myxococcota bacterium]|nr:NAD(P)/FAD-dependent oxidoreductase [Myxococcota bacterium]
MTHVVVVGGGFGGLAVAKGLRKARDVEVTLIDRRNHHLFQPLLYQVAMAGLSPAEIAAPIRSLLSTQRNTSVRLDEVRAVDTAERRIETSRGPLAYDVLVLACGARHAYFGHDAWEEHAPGLKSVEEATEIRRRVLSAYEQAEMEKDPARQKMLLTFVVVGGGPTGVELAGALGEMSRFTLARDFRHIDPALARVILIEAGPRILPSFAAELARRATRDLESLGVQVWTSSAVTGIDAAGVDVGPERIQTATALWAAGVQPSPLAKSLGAPLDRVGRVQVEADLSVPGHPEIFAIGDMACARGEDGKPLPGLAPVAKQEGAHVARNIMRSLRGEPREPFRYRDRGQMATIGRSRAICDLGRVRFAGFVAWLAWLVVHIYFLVGFKNRLFVVLSWAWSYLTFRRGARLIVDRDWHGASG